MVVNGGKLTNHMLILAGWDNKRKSLLHNPKSSRDLETERGRKIM